MTALGTTGEREILLMKNCLGLGKFGLSLLLLFFWGGWVKRKNLDNGELTILVCSVLPEHSCYPDNSCILGQWEAQV